MWHGGAAVPPTAGVTPHYLPPLRRAGEHGARCRGGWRHPSSPPLREESSQVKTGRQGPIRPMRRPKWY